MAPGVSQMVPNGFQMVPKLHFKLLVAKSGHVMQNIAFLKIYELYVIIHVNGSKFYADFKNLIFNAKKGPLQGFF